MSATEDLPGPPSITAANTAIRAPGLPKRKAPISVVVPTFREAENIPVLARRLFAALERANIPGELILVDDDSQDGLDILVRVLERSVPVRLITRTDERGLSSAVIRGFHEARHDILVCMDADLSHPPESVPSIAEAVASGETDFCIGSRYVPGASTTSQWSWLREINSKGATLLARPLTRVNDPMAGFFCLRRRTLRRAEKAGLNPIGYKIGLEILVKSGCDRVLEVPIDFADRMHGKSKLTFKEQLRYLRHLARLYRHRWPMAAPLAVAAPFAAALTALCLM